MSELSRGCCKSEMGEPHVRGCGNGQPFLADMDRPTVSAMRRYGISPDYGYLIGDMVLEALGLGGVWPQDHYWHLWAVKNAEARHGRKAVRNFVLCLAEAYDVKFPGLRRAA